MIRVYKQTHSFMIRVYDIFIVTLVYKQTHITGGEHHLVVIFHHM